NQPWNACLDMLVKLETGPGGRIPENRHKDYVREIDAMRIGARRRTNQALNLTALSRRRLTAISLGRPSPGKSVSRTCELVRRIVWPNEGYAVTVCHEHSKRPKGRGGAQLFN